MADFTVEVTGLKPFGKRVSNRISKLKNLSPAYKRAVTLYFQWIQKNFQAQGRLHDNASLRWKPLKRSTIAGRRKGGGGAKILQDTGELRKRWELRSSSQQGIIKSGVDYSTTHEYGARIPAHIVRPRNAKALRWVNGDGEVIYAKSAKIPAYNIPQRKIFPEIRQAQKIIEPAFTDHLEWK